MEKIERKHFKPAILLICALMGVIGGIVAFLSPSHPAIVLGLILLVGFTVNRIIALTTHKRNYSIIAFMITVLLLSINYAVGFDPVNTFLIICFAVGLIIVIK